MQKYFSAFIAFVAISFMPAFAEDVKISRDDFGVPHIYSESDEGAFYGQGYAQACDRLFQLEMVRLSSSGKMSEVLGKGYIDYDKMYLRYFPIDDELTTLVKSFPESQRTKFKAFADGINARIDEVVSMGKVPEEFAKYGIEPVKWTEADVFKVCFARYRYIYDGAEELTNLRFLQKLVENYGQIDGKLIFDSILKLNDQTASSIVSDINPFMAEKVIADNKKDIEASKELAKKFGVPYGVGSYAVVLSASKSATGNSMLLSGPQYGFSDPSLFYECSLHSKDIHCYGIQTVGLPGLSIAQNKYGAWTVTGGSDNQIDYYIEMLNPSNNTQYRSDDVWKDMTIKSYKINVKNSEPVDFDIVSTNNGFVVSTELSDPKNPMAYVKSVAVTPEEIASSWMNTYNAMKSYSTDSFVKAFKTYPISSNIFYINQKNPPVFMHTGKYPLRAEGVDSRLPQRGMDTGNKKEFLSYDKIPIYRNTSRGFYADWNSKPSLTWDNGEKTYIWGSQNRVNHVRSYVDVQKKFTFGDLDAIDYKIAYMDIYANEIKPLLIEKLSKSQDSNVVKAVEYLKDWDGYKIASANGYYEKPAIPIFHRWMNEFAKLLCPEIDGKYMEYAVNEYGAPFIFNVLSEASLPYDFLKGRSVEDVSEEAMKNTIYSLSNSNGYDMSQWREKAEVSTYVSPVPQSSEDMSLPSGEQIYCGNRASTIMMWEVNRFWVKGVSVLTPGEGAYVGNDSKPSHKDDQKELYNIRRYKTVLFYDEDIRHKEESSNTLKYTKPKK